MPRVEQQRWVAKALESDESRIRDPKWSESIAVGSQPYIAEVAEMLAVKSRFREVQKQDGVFMIRDPSLSYNIGFRPENDAVSAYFGGNIQ